MGIKVRLSRQLLHDCPVIDIAEMLKPDPDPRPFCGPPLPPAHESHVFSNEGLEGCLLCGLWTGEELVAECAFEVVPRRR